MSMSSQQSDIKLFEQIDRENNRIRQLDEVSLGDSTSPALLPRESGNASVNARRGKMQDFFPPSYQDYYMGDSDGASPPKTPL
jgi:hypothetical protein